jgi:pyruvate,water dikinase
MNRWAFGPEQLTAPTASEIGGKALGLLRLREAGAAVPPFAVIPAAIAETRPWNDDPACLEELRRWYDAHVAPPFTGIAVRSSADLEDRDRASGAGVFETVLLDAPSGLVDALNRVCDSVRGEAATAYRAWTGRPEPPRMSVVLQARVPARIAGVLFSANPSSAHPARAYAEVVMGVGAGLVDGSRTPSRFHLELASRSVVTAETGADGPNALKPDVVTALFDTLLAVERAFDSPVDIEWVAHGKQVWFLQARPVTALRADPSLRPPECATSWFYDQRFTEPIHPFTRGTLLPLIARTAVVDALALRHRPAPDPLLYFYGGQAYILHRAYREMLAGAPRWWLSTDLRQLFPARCPCDSGGGRASVFDYAWCAAAAVWKHRGDVFRNIRAWERFRDGLPGSLGIAPPELLGNRASWEAEWDRLDALTLRLLEIHRWSILWAGYYYRAFTLTKRLTPKALASRMDHRLLSQTRLITSEANAALDRIGPTTPPEEVQEFVARFGHRSGSLDYAVPTWAELITAFVSPAREAAVCETPAKQTCVDHVGQAHFASFFWPLRRFLELREEQRFEWERILARQRRMVAEAGDHLTARGILSEPDDVWFLEKEELLDALFDGAAVSPGTLDLRRHTHRLERCMDKPQFLGPGEPEPPPEGDALHGLGASPGVVRGRVWLPAKAESAPRGLEPPVIAVLTALDPAGTRLLAEVQGVVIERGGMLSHAAILAREYRVPLVIGVEHATQRLKAGMEITVDADRGMVLLHGDIGPGGETQS